MEKPPADKPLAERFEHGLEYFIFASRWVQAPIYVALIFAAVTASFLGANAQRRRPVVLGALLALPVAASLAAPRGGPPGREAVATRMRPFSDCAEGFPRMVRDLARQLGKAVRFEVAGKATPVHRSSSTG